MTKFDGNAWKICVSGCKAVSLCYEEVYSGVLYCEIVGKILKPRFYKFCDTKNLGLIEWTNFHFIDDMLAPLVSSFSMHFFFKFSDCLML